MPKKRIPPSKRLSNEIIELMQNLNGTGNNQELLSKLMQLSMRKTIQEILEAEVKDYIGKAYYAHGQDRAGYRNGYKAAHIRTTDDRLLIERPQIDDTEEKFPAKTWQAIKGNSPRLEKMVVEMYARGCSTRDIEALLKDEHGNILLSKSAISALNERLWQEYETFCKSDLSKLDVTYIFCDAVYESMRLHKGPKESILVVWAILSDGQKLILTMVLGQKESYDDWLCAFRNLRKRGLCDPILGVSDGAPGLIKAFSQAFPKTLRQRCLVHKKRNITGKVPQEAASEIKAHLNAVYFAPNKKAALVQAQAFRDAYTKLYPSAIACFDDDLEACLMHLECPAKHRRYITSTNLLERAFLEERRRTNTLPRFFNERSALKLAYATLIRASSTWRRLRFSFDEQAKIMELRYRLGHKAVKEQAIRKAKRLSYVA